MQKQVNTHDDLSWLLSAAWWRSSAHFVCAIAKRLIFPALLLAFSNVCSALADSLMRGRGIEIGEIGNQMALDKALGLLAFLLLCVSIGLITGLLALSIWLLDLTAIARQLLIENSSLDQCLKELKSKSGYLGKVWIISLLYLLVPVLPMSVLMAFSIIANMNLTVLDEPLLPIPTEFLLLINFNAAILLLVTLDFSLIVTVLSATTALSPKLVNSKAKDILLKNLPRISILNIALILLNLLVSAPFAIMFVLPQFAALWKNLYVNIACQVWFALSSIFTWPLTILAFVEYLKRISAVEMINEEKAGA